MARLERGSLSSAMPRKGGTKERRTQFKREMGEQITEDALPHRGEGGGPLRDSEELIAFLESG